jgi:hypothetical protein
MLYPVRKLEYSQFRGRGGFSAASKDRVLLPLFDAGERLLQVVAAGPFERHFADRWSNRSGFRKQQNAVCSQRRFFPTSLAKNVEISHERNQKQENPKPLAA